MERVAGGQAMVQKQLSRHNQEVTDGIIRSEIGLRPNTPLGFESIASRRAELGDVYENVAQISTQARNTLESLQKARTDMKVAWRRFSESRATNRGGDPDLEAAAEALTLKAEGLENQLESIAKQSGNNDLFGEFKQARKTLSKIHVVESALNAYSGNVDATLIGKIADKNPRLLTGGLQAIGALANIQPRAMSLYDASKNVQAKQLGTFYGPAALGGMAGYQAGGGSIVGAGLGALAGAGANLGVSSGLRALQTGDAYQKFFGMPQYGSPTPSGVSNFLRAGSMVAGR
jgi:hypothetical protein